MAGQICSNEKFIETWNRLGSPQMVSDALGMNITNVYKRRRHLEAKGTKLETWNDTSDRRVVIKKEEGRIDLTIQNGVVIVFSDAHYWPGIRTTAHRALLSLIKQLHPVAVVCNGDAFDGGAISKYPRIGWDKKPTVHEELGAVKERLGEVEEVTDGEKIWTLGNHDARYETKLAAVAPEFEGVGGFTLKDHFPSWRPCWTCWINNDVRINHAYHTGQHDGWNNLLKGQVHAVTSHTHALKVTPLTDARGETIYAVNTGTLADAISSHNVDYQRGMHGNHRSGCAVLTFRDGKLLMPELCQVWSEGVVNFRGHLLDADTGAVV